MLKCKSLFEIPVYRISEEQYYKKQNSYIEQSNQDKEYPIDKSYLSSKYGGDWRYNEIIGYLRFYKYGANQIRCEYWETEAKRKVRTRKKQFIMVSDSYCREPFAQSASNAELANVMKSAVEHCQIRLKPRVLDRSLFDATVDLIDWQTFLN